MKNLPHSVVVDLVDTEVRYPLQYCLLSRVPVVGDYLRLNVQGRYLEAKVSKVVLHDIDLSVDTQAYVEVTDVTFC